MAQTIKINAADTRALGGYRRNADFNAAENIRDKYLVGWSSPSDVLSSTSVSCPSEASVSA